MVSRSSYGYFMKKRAFFIELEELPLGHGLLLCKPSLSSLAFRDKRVNDSPELNIGYMFKETFSKPVDTNQKDV